MSKSKSHDVVVASLMEVAPNVDPSKLDRKQNFRDQFDFDSIDQLNFVLALQIATNIEIPGLDYPQLAGLDAAVNYIESRLGDIGSG